MVPMTVRDDRPCRNVRRTWGRGERERREKRVSGVGGKGRRARGRAAHLSVLVRVALLLEGLGRLLEVEARPQRSLERALPLAPVVQGLDEVPHVALGAVDAPVAGIVLRGPRAVQTLRGAPLVAVRGEKHGGHLRGQDANLVDAAWLGRRLAACVHKEPWGGEGGRGERMSKMRREERQEERGERREERKNG